MLVENDINSIVLEEIERALFTSVVLVFLMNSSVMFSDERESLSIERALVKSMYPTHIFKSVCGARVENLVVQ